MDQAARGAARDWAFVAALCLARVAFGYQFQSLASLGPELIARFQLDYRSLGTLIGLYMLPGVLVALPGGLLGRRFGGGALVGAGLALMGAGSLLPVLLFDPAWLATGRVVAGIGAVAVTVMQGKLVADRFAGPRFMPVMGLVVGSFPAGVGLVALTHDPLLAAVGPRGLLLVASLLPLLSLLLFLPSVGPARAVQAGWGFPSGPECRLVLVAGLIWTAYNAGYYGFLSYMPSLLTARGHAPGVVATVLVTATWANVPATIIGGALAARFGTWPVFLVGLLAEVAAVLGPALADWPLAWGLLFGTAAALPAGVIVALGTLSARPANQAVGMGLFYTLFYLGGGVLPGVCGLAADYAGSPRGALVAAAAMTALAIPLYLLHRAMQRRRAAAA